MASKKIDASNYAQDIIDFIIFLNKYKVKYVIIGGQAVIFYGHSRLTGDVDFFYEKSEQNSNKLFFALNDFWDGDIPAIQNAHELLQDNLILQFGVPPNRIDLINDLENIDFKIVWKNKEIAHLKTSSSIIPVYFISLDLLIKNKEIANRPRDIEDLNFLKAIKTEKKDPINKN